MLYYYIQYPMIRFNYLIKSFKILLIAAAGLILNACSNNQQIPANLKDSFELHSLSEKIKALTPDGWDLNEKVDFFTPDNLYQRINGRAELYLSYDVIGMATATFDRKGDIGDFIELSIFDMGSATNAFGIFSVERSSDEKDLELGRMGYLSGSNTYIWTSDYYITIVVSDTTEELTQLTKDMAGKVTDFLPDNGTPVWGLSAFPADNLIPESIKYFKTDTLGLDFMQDTYTAKYRIGNQEVTVFLSRKAARVDAKKTVDRYLEYCRRYGLGSKQLTDKNLDFHICDMDGKFDVIFYAGRLVFGVVSAADRDTAVELISELGKQLSLD